LAGIFPSRFFLNCSYLYSGAIFLKSIQSLLRSILLITFLCSPVITWAKSPVSTLDGIVLSVADGNHIFVNSNGHDLQIKLYGIDAPVITKMRRSDPYSKPGQPFAGKAFMALSNKILHKQVKVEVMNRNPEKVVAIIFLENRNINLEMVNEGWAWASEKNRKQPEETDYTAAEEKARARRVGLWSQDNPQPPWEFRKNLK
jgi:endonuclease YncB( thermonuclease family)